MTAPTLTPAEQAEVTRFGAHDEEILRDLAEHANEVIPCEWEDAAASWRITIRCCSTDSMVCQKHRDAIRDTVTSSPSARFHCVHCGTYFPRGSAYPDIIREVQL
ncbi:hypothetical protein [uncultured Microbacterium sp.]|uniref:hypothetical protein n=1 Tax=uncultured Microbacterium sp. TaxID=191216 RepID=UPI0025CB8558|nr:hypothetical protein [uncultured Microbacterium sp.]